MRPADARSQSLGLAHCLKCCTWLLQSHMIAQTRVSRKGGGDSSWENGKECIMKQIPRGKRKRARQAGKRWRSGVCGWVVVCMLRTTAPPRCRGPQTRENADHERPTAPLRCMRRCTLRAAMCHLPVAAGHGKAAGKLVHLAGQLLHVLPLRALCRQVRAELLQLAGGGRLGLAVL